MGFVSSRSLKTREKYTNWDNLVCFSLYIFWGKCVYFSILEWWKWILSIKNGKVNTLLPKILSQFVYFFLVLREWEEIKTKYSAPETVEFLLSSRCSHAMKGATEKEKIMIITMVFCYQNCSDLLWEKHLIFETKGREFANILRSLEQFVRSVKGQNNFW